MIRTALVFIKNELDAYIVEREQHPAYMPGGVVSLQPIVTLDGSPAPMDKHIVSVLVGVNEVCIEGKRSYYIPTDDKQFYKLHPPVELDLFVLFAANSTDYVTALRDLSEVVSFFQSNPVFDAQKYPTLNAEAPDPDTKPWQTIERLSCSIYNPTFEQLNNLWAMHGGKFMPSIVYKISMLTVFETKSKEKVPSITELDFVEK
jgi:hypothetical protein